MHNDVNGLLRCILTIKLPKYTAKCHILVFVVTEGDKCYIVTNFPDALQDQLENDLDNKRLTVLNYDA